MLKTPPLFIRYKKDSFKLHPCELRTFPELVLKKEIRLLTEFI